MDGKIGQIVDSAGGIPRQLIRALGIKEVPFYYSFDDKTYVREHVDQGNEVFYQEMLKDPDRAPKTSAPNVADWIRAFAEAYSEGARRLIVTTISPRLSASYQNACMATESFLNQHPDVDIEVISSVSCAAGQAAFEMRIADLIKSGSMSWERLIAHIKSLVPGVTTLFTVYDMAYMKAGGRIGGAAALLGRLVDLKPVCEFKAGVVHPIKAVRGRKKSLLAMVDTVCYRIKDATSAVICIQNALCEEDAYFLRRNLEERLSGSRIMSGMLGATVGAHSGPGAIGIGYVEG